jgi:dihydroxyacid dehydratase/phosphogluconate dehydratase
MEGRPESGRIQRVVARLPVIVNMRPFGAYSMVDVDAAGGLPTSS